jgi:hypothetical protein
VAFLPETYEDYFKAIGVQPPKGAAGDGSPPTSLEAFMSKNLNGSSGVPLTNEFITELYRQLKVETSEVRISVDKKDRAAAFFEDALPIPGGDRRLWFGVQVRLNPNGSLLQNSATAAYLANQTVVICMDQIFRMTWIESKSQTLPADYYVTGWLSAGGTIGLGSGFTDRLRSAVGELEYKKKTGGLTENEKKFLELSEEERFELGARYINAVFGKKHKATLDVTGIADYFQEVRTGGVKAEAKGSASKVLTIGKDLRGDTPLVRSHGGIRHKDCESFMNKALEHADWERQYRYDNSPATEKATFHDQLKERYKAFAAKDYRVKIEHIGRGGTRYTLAGLPEKREFYERRELPDNALLKFEVLYYRHLYVTGRADRPAFQAAMTHGFGGKDPKLKMEECIEVNEKGQITDHPAVGVQVVVDVRSTKLEEPERRVQKK